MKRLGKLGLMALAALSAVGCNLIDSSGLHLGYSFDPQEFKQMLGNGTMQTVPSVACAAGMSPDPCAAFNAMLPPDSGTVACDAAKKMCVATAEIRLPQQIDLRNAMTPLPADAVKLGISSVAIDKIDYWVAQNTLNVATPPVDLYVAAATAKDEHDPTAHKLGTVASLQSKSMTCGDPPDASGDPAANGMKVCKVPLTSDGQAALGTFVQNFKTAPFQIIVHAVVTATGGTPVPSGTLDLFVRPSVTLSILK